MQVTLKVNCLVQFIHSDRLSYKTNRPDAFEILESSNSRLEIRQIAGSGGISIVSGGGSTFINNISDRTVISGGGNVVIGNMIGGHTGEVYINDRRVTSEGIDSSSTSKPAPVLTIYIPPQTNVKVKTSGSCTLEGNGLIGLLDLSTSGSTDVDLSVYNASLSTSGSSDIKLKMLSSSPQIKSRFSGSTNFEMSMGG